MNMRKISEHLQMCGKIAVVHNKEDNTWFVMNENNAVLKSRSTLAECIRFAKSLQTEK